jgi:exonuclease SbcC
LRAIQLTNFRQHADTAIEFAAGITGIIGPNGTGKTTILEAIAWALYGNEAARGKRDSIRFARADAKAPVRVELDFELAGHRYRVVRGLTSAELYLDGGTEPIANSLTSVSDMLQRRIGMSRSEFFNTYFTGQKELTVMTSLGPTERAQFLSRVLGYERLRSAQELARERRRDLLAELNGLRQAMPDPEAVVRALQDASERLDDAKRRSGEARSLCTRATERLAEIKPRWEAAQRERTTRQQMSTDLGLAELDLVARERDLERAEVAQKDLDAAQSELASVAPRLIPLQALVSERNALDALAREEGKRQTIMQGAKLAQDDLARLRERHERLKDAPRLEKEIAIERDARRAELAQTAATLENARTLWVRSRQEAETKRDALRVQYADVKEQRERIVEAGEEGICPTCQRPLGTHFRSVLDVLSAQLDSVRVDGNYYKGRVEQLSTVPAEVVQLEAAWKAQTKDANALERRCAELHSEIKQLAELTAAIARQEERLAAIRSELDALPTGYDSARHALVKREIESLAPIEQRATRLLALVERAGAVRAEFDAALAARDAAGARAAVLRTAVAEYLADEAAYLALESDYEAADTVVRDAELLLARVEVEAAGAEGALALANTARASLARSEERLNTLTRERRLHDELDHAYTDLRTDLNFALRPELSRLASAFLSDLTDGRYTELDLDDQYNLVIVEDGTPKPVISGGEEDLANLVVRLAISQMIAERAGQAFSLLVLDEVFGSLDEVRRQNVVELLRALHDRFEQVILITHIESVRDGCDHVLMVRFDPATGAAVVSPADDHAVADDVLVGAEQ